jgi:hypothetical protein
MFHEVIHELPVGNLLKYVAINQYMLGRGSHLRS